VNRSIQKTKFIDKEFQKLGMTWRFCRDRGICVFGLKMGVLGSRGF